MKPSVIFAWNRFLKLINFLAWYLIVLAGIFYLLPMIGLLLEDKLDALARPVKLVAIVGFFATMAWWQMKNRKADSDAAGVKNSNRSLSI